MSAFRELRLAAGYRITQLARELNADRNAVSKWDRALWKPRWRNMPTLARIFGIDLEQAAAAIWNERVADLCSCGCGGLKVLPTRAGAKHLYIELPCRKCGTARVYRVMQGHDTLCRGCSYASRRTERVTLKCVGYRPLGNRKGDNAFADGCPGEQTFLKSRLGFYRVSQNRNEKNRVQRSIRDDGARHFINEAQGKFRCGKCAGALRLTFFKRHRDIEGIKPNVKNNHGPGKGYKIPKHRTAAKHWLGTEDFPGYVHGLCWLCGKILFAYMSEERKKTRPLRFHQKCILEYQREHGQHSAPEQHRDAGRPQEPESLKKHFAWALRKVRGDSYGEIADDFKISRPAVVKGISSIVDLLPDCDCVSETFHKKISLLRELS